MLPIQAIRKSIRIDGSGSLHFQQQAPPAAAPHNVVQERKVEFHSRVRCIGRSKTHKTEDLKARWYTKEEIASFRKRDKKYIQTLITTTSSPATCCLTGDDDSDEVSLIGLMSKKDLLQRVKRIREARALVTREQLSQEEKFFADHANLESFQLDQEFISEIYSGPSRNAAELAHTRAVEISCHVDNLWEKKDHDVGNRGASFRKYQLVRSAGSINLFSRMNRAG